MVHYPYIGLKTPHGSFWQAAGVLLAENAGQSSIRWVNDDLALREPFAIPKYSRIVYGKKPSSVNLAPLLRV